jgi:hypothetical protein
LSLWVLRSDAQNTIIGAAKMQAKFRVYRLLVVISTL